MPGVRSEASAFGLNYFMGLKNAIRKSRARRRKVVRTPGQLAKDAKEWACGRKIPYFTREEAQAVADKLSHRVYQCAYAEHFHTAHLPGSRRFVRGVSA